MIDTYAVVKKLIGKIEPIGDASIDGKRFGNLENLTILVNKLVYDIDNVAYGNKDSQLHSERKAGEYASNFLFNLNIKE